MSGSTRVSLQRDARTGFFSRSLSEELFSEGRVCFRPRRKISIWSCSLPTYRPTTPPTKSDPVRKVLMILISNNSGSPYCYDKLSWPHRCASTRLWCFAHIVFLFYFIFNRRIQWWLRWSRWRRRLRSILTCLLAFLAAHYWKCTLHALWFVWR